MKNLSILLGATIALLLNGCLMSINNSESDVPQKPLPKEHIVLKTSGADVVEFSGTLKVDGESREIHATSPWELPLDCGRVSGRIKKVHGPGDLEFTITNPKGWCSFSASPNCRFEYSEGGVVVTSFP